MVKLSLVELCTSYPFFGDPQCTLAITSLKGPGGEEWGVYSIWIGISHSSWALHHIMPLTNKTNVLLNAEGDAALF